MDNSSSSIAICFIVSEAISYPLNASLKRLKRAYSRVLELGPLVKLTASENISHSNTARASVAVDDLTLWLLRTKALTTLPYAHTERAPFASSVICK